MNCILFVVYNKTIEKREKSLDDGAHFFLLVAMADGGNRQIAEGIVCQRSKHRPAFHWAGVFICRHGPDGGTRAVMRLYAGSNPAGGSNSALPRTFHAYEHNAYAYHGGCKYADAGAALRGRGRFDSGNRRQAVIRVMGWRLPGACRVKKARMPGYPGQRGQAT